MVRVGVASLISCALGALLLLGVVSAVSDGGPLGLFALLWLLFS